MTTSLILIAITINILIGYLIVSLLLDHIPSLANLFLFKLSLGTGMGIGVTSLLSFLWQVIFGKYYSFYPVLEIVLLSALFFLWRRRRSSTPLETPKNVSSPSGWTVFLLIVFVVEILIGLLTFIFAMIQFPYGPWDAWRLWNRAARFLYAGGDFWRNGFSPLLHLPDYPILLGSSVARVWRYAGGEAVLAPALISLAFTAALVALLVSALSHLRGRALGLLGGLLLFSASSLFVFAPAQWADIPIAFYFLSTVILLHYYFNEPQPYQALPALAGTACALSTWTKNEGWPFLPAVIAIYFVLVPLLKKRRLELKPMLSFLLGALPVLLVVLYFKLAVAPPNYLFSGQPEEYPLIERMLDPQRYQLILQGYLLQLYDLRPDHSVPLLFLFTVVLLLGLRSRQLFEYSPLSMTLVSLALFVMYFVIYLATPMDLKWQITTSFYRLTLQLWPILVFGAALLLTGVAPASIQGKINAQPGDEER